MHLKRVRHYLGYYVTALDRVFRVTPLYLIVERGVRVLGRCFHEVLLVRLIECGLREVENAAVKWSQQIRAAICKGQIECLSRRELLD